MLIYKLGVAKMPNHDCSVPCLDAILVAGIRGGVVPKPAKEKQGVFVARVRGVDVVLADRSRVHVCPVLHDNPLAHERGVFTVGDSRVPQHAELLLRAQRAKQQEWHAPPKRIPRGSRALGEPSLSKRMGACAAGC